MSRTGAVVCSMVGVGLVAAASAQVPPGKFDVAPRYVPQNVRSEEMGRCAVRYDRRRAVAVVMSHNGDEDSREAVKRFIPALTNCLGGAGSATLDPSYLRGGIAEALLVENEQALLTTAAGLAPVAPARVAMAGSGEPIVTLMTCVAAAQPGDAAAVIASPAASPAEAAAFRKMIPSLQACAPATGEVHISPARIRPTTAIALYRLVALR